METLNLFYEEPNEDRWFRYDRFPRQIVRRLVRGKPRISGQKRVFLNLIAGLNQLGIAHRVNSYRHIQQHHQETACIVGRYNVLDKIDWKNPIIFGASIFSHPLDDPNLLQRLPIQKVLVPGEWTRKMFEPYYGDRVVAWPVGIDTEQWQPNPDLDKDIDILIYDKVLWERDIYEPEFITPILEELASIGLKTHLIKYGFYREPNFHSLLARSKAMIFLCEHETQGIAYQQALSCGVPILAWDRGGFWHDPGYFPDRVRYETVTSVPYWDNRCGLKFPNLAQFSAKLERFLHLLDANKFDPRTYILENLTLKKAAQNYLDIVRAVAKNTAG